MDSNVKIVNKMGMSLEGVIVMKTPNPKRQTPNQQVDSNVKIVNRMGMSLEGEIVMKTPNPKLQTPNPFAHWRIGLWRIGLYKAQIFI